ncbi:hypothetical protein HDK77DRAFT_122001 [Phyllosticta capitalensis]
MGRELDSWKLAAATDRRHADGHLSDTTPHHFCFLFFLLVWAWLHSEGAGLLGLLGGWVGVFGYGKWELGIGTVACLSFQGNCLPNWLLVALLECGVCRFGCYGMAFGACVWLCCVQS